MNKYNLIKYYRCYRNDTFNYTNILGDDIILCGLLLSGISSCLTSINFFATIINMRCYSMTLSKNIVFSFHIY